MKRIVSLFLFLLILISLCGCSESGKTGGDTEAEQNTEETVSVSMSAIETEPVTEAPEPEEVYTASFVGCGDNIVYFGNVRDAQAAAVSGGRKYNFKPAYSDVADYIAAADISYINQETLMCGEGYELSYYPMFNGPQELGYDLVETGFDIINIANNHMLDKGGAGLQRTIDFWRTQPVTLIGGYSNKAEYDQAVVIEKNGIRIGLLSYCEMTNGITINAKYDNHIPYLKEADFKAQVDGIKDRCDIIIASVHWGEEYQFDPNDTQRAYAKQMSDAGIDVILGHHPHVIQPIEWIEGEDGNRTLCAYSLGNFMAEMSYASNMLGGFISFDITKTGDNRATVENVVFEPTVFHFPSNFYNNHIYFMKDYTEQLASVHGVRTYYKKHIDFATLKGYLRDTISDEFLSEEIIALINE